MSEKNKPTLKDSIKKELTTNLGPNLGSLVTNPLASAALATTGELINARDTEHQLLRGLGVGTGAALGATTRPVFSALSKKILSGLHLHPGDIVGNLIPDVATGITQYIAAKKLRSAAEALGDVIATRQNKENTMKTDGINLDSFHKLNPEARPKTAEQFKLALSPNWTRIGEIAKGAAKPAAASAAIGAIGGLIAAPEGKGLSGAAQGAVAGGLMGGAGGALHHGMMTGKSDLAKDYQDITTQMRREQNKMYRSQRRANQNIPYTAGAKAAESDYNI